MPGIYAIFNNWHGSSNLLHACTLVSIGFNLISYCDLLVFTLEKIACDLYLCCRIRNKSCMFDLLLYTFCQVCHFDIDAK
jgi:hypothetical protein